MNPIQYIGPSFAEVADLDELSFICDWHAENASHEHWAWAEIDLMIDQGASLDDLKAEAAALDFREEVISLDPIVPWALQAALDHLISEGIIPKTGRNRGQTWLAAQVKVSPRTVRRWLAGDSQLSGPPAELVRIVLGKVA